LSWIRIPLPVPELNQAYRGERRWGAHPASVIDISSPFLIWIAHAAASVGTEINFKDEELDNLTQAWKAKGQPAWRFSVAWGEMVTPGQKRRHRTTLQYPNCKFPSLKARGSLGKDSSSSLGKRSLLSWSELGLLFQEFPSELSAANFVSQKSIHKDLNSYLYGREFFHFYFSILTLSPPA
jgi:hypothetical protein